MLSEAKMLKRTVMRSVRISQALDDVLRRDAESRGISISSLVSEIFTKYSEWDRLANKFGMMTFSGNAFKKVWEIIDEEQAINWGKEGGSKTAVETARFWFKRLNTRTFFKLIELYSKYTNFFEYEFERKGERDYAITVHHEINEKFSIFLENWFESAIKIFVGVTAKCEVSRNSVLISFAEPRSIPSAF